MKHQKKKLIVLLADLNEHSSREACVGAAEYIATCHNLHFEPWPISAKDGAHPQLSDFRSVDGLLLTQRAAKLVFREKRIKIPHVFLLPSQVNRDEPSVGLDEKEFGKMAAIHLMERGYQHFASICINSMAWSCRRADGFDTACRGRKQKSERYEFKAEELPAYWTSNIVRRREKLKNILEKLPKPCGIFAANDVLAFFVMEAAQSCGFVIPGDIAVIGVDDDPIPNASAGLAISSVQPPFREIGRQAVAMLDRKMLECGDSKQLSLPPIKTVVRPSTDAFSVPNALLQRAQYYIEKHRHESLRVRDLIRHLSTTPNTLGKQFHRYLQTTPADYILLRRIEYAKELLREGKLNVQEVSEICCYHSCSYFCKTFRKMTGVTPNDVRKEVCKPIPRLIK